MGWFSKWFSRDKKEESARDKRDESASKSKKTAPPPVKTALPSVKTEQIIKPQEIRLAGLEQTLIKTMYGQTRLYYDKMGTEVLFIQTEVPLSQGETIIPSLDSANQVIGYYVVKSVRAKSIHSGKELYFFEKAVPVYEMSEEDMAYIKALASKLNIDVALPYTKKEAVEQQGMNNVDKFKSSIECATIIYPTNDGRQLSDVIGKIVNVGRYVRTPQVFILNTERGNYLLLSENYATIIDKVGMVVAEELPVDMSGQMCVRLTYNNKSKDVTVLPLKK